mgnify:CR=1 FL=1
MTTFSVAFQGNKPIADYVRYAKIMEQLDFDAFLVYDDVMYRPCWPILFSVAPHTAKLQLGPSVTHPYYTHPVFIAGNIACLDEILGGRAVLGIGRGSYYEELGVETTKPITGVKEAIEIVTRFMRSDKNQYEGRVFRVSEGIAFKYKPIRAKIPIFVGTWGPKLAEIAGQMNAISEVRVDLTWNSSYLPTIRKSIDRGAAAAGRDPNEIGLCVGPQTSVSADRDLARNAVRRSLPDYLSYPPYRVMLEKSGVDLAEVDAVTHAVSENDYRTAENLISDLSIDKLTASGTPDDIVQGAERMIKSGVSHISFCHPHGPDVEEAIRLIGTKVIPYLKGL